MSEEKKPLYGFYMDEKGCLKKEVNTSYTILSAALRKEYRFTRGYQHIHVKDARLDRYTNGYVYTFNPDETHAEAIIRKTLENKIKQLEGEVAKTQAKLDLLNKGR